MSDISCRVLDSRAGGFRGPEEFIKRLDSNELVPGQIVRVYNYGVSVGGEGFFVVGTEKRVYDIKTDKPANPKEFLSKEKAPDGWSFEGFDPCLLPEGEIDNALRYIREAKD